ncbi:MAG TPA: tetratricopeptide repeat protein [Vicinamibacterales bacterium]|jgi:Flp pilus assembly protein TadD|nr:tetratricopeptide repeat protein [Vicinamibacterales bacterium]
MKIARAASSLLALSLLAACRDAPAGGPEGPPLRVDNPTYNEQVAPILFARCGTCHRPIDSAWVRRGGPSGPPGASGPGDPDDPLCIAGAPFSVLDYPAVARRAKAIASAVQQRRMPPWLPQPGHGDFMNERRLRDDEIATITAWASHGAPEGDASKRPAIPSFPGGWQLGTPDLVLTSAETYTLRPGREDSFRTFVLPVPSGPARYVRGIEFRADNPQVLHHANVGLDPRRIGRRLDRADAEPGFAAMPEGEVQDVFGWSPGKVPVMEPADTAWVLDEGSDLVAQLHMVPGATAQTVRPQVGLFFSTTPPTRVPMVVKLESKSIDIPAGKADYVVEDSYTLPVDVEAVSVYPHAHYLATRMEGSATMPDGRVTPLLSIPRWNIRWQDQYRYRTPQRLPRGTTLRMRFEYDNSAANPANRSKPPQRVQWGPLSTDEMGALWLEVVPARPEDAAMLERDYQARALKADLAAAELAAQAHPGDAAVMNRLATRYLQAGRVGDAVAQLRQAVRIAPRDAAARSNLGTALQARGEVPAAIRELEAAAGLKPNDDSVRFNLGNGYYAAGRAADAVRELTRAVALNAENADAHFNLAMILGPRGQLDEAIAHLRHVIEIDPQRADAHRNLAMALGLQGRRP